MPRAGGLPIFEHGLDNLVMANVRVGTGNEIERIVRERRPDADFALVSNPEFRCRGTAIEDFKRPYRVGVGTEEAWVEDLRARAYPHASVGNV